MFDYIKGNCVSSGDGYIVIENSGIGFQIYTSLFTKSKLLGNDNVTVFTYLYIREGIMDLYGFESIEERSMFLQLLSVNGIGPKAALSILSVAPTNKIAFAIMSGDHKLLTQAQGVGPKVAQRIVMELKDKLKGFEDVANIEIDDTPLVLKGNNVNEALSALVVLGYSENEAKSALSGVDMSLDTELIIKEALKRLF